MPDLHIDDVEPNYYHPINRNFFSEREENRNLEQEKWKINQIGNNKIKTIDYLKPVYPKSNTNLCFSKKLLSNKKVNLLKFIWGI